MHVCTSVSTRSDYTNFHLTSLDSAAAALATVCERKTIQKKQKGVTIVWAGGPQSSGKESTYTGRASQIVNTSPPRKTTASLQWVTKSYIAEGGLAFSIFQPLGYKDKTFQATEEVPLCRDSRARPEPPSIEDRCRIESTDFTETDVAFAGFSAHEKLHNVRAASVQYPQFLQCPFVQIFFLRIGRCSCWEDTVIFEDSKDFLTLFYMRVIKFLMSYIFFLLPHWGSYVFVNIFFSIY